MKLLNRLRDFRKEQGQILLLMGLLATALLGLTGLVVDAGYLYAQRRQVQNAADASALAAAWRLHEGASQATAMAAGYAYAHDNGYDNNQTDNWVDVSFFPLDNPEAAEAIIEEEPVSFFIHAILPGPNRVKARALADTVDVPRQYALIVLNEEECGGYDQAGQGDVILTGGGGAMINPDCDVGLERSGASIFQADGDIDATGGAESVGSGDIDPDPRVFVPWQLDDPLADLTPPYPACLGWAPPCLTRNGSAGPGGEDLLQITGATDVIVQPGVYYGGMKVNCSCAVTFQPGIYVMAGGGFTKTGGTNIQGDSVMIYVTKHPTESAGSSGDGFHLGGTGSVALSGLLYCVPFGPPCLPPYENTKITFWQDESVTDEFFFAGDASGTTGIWYAPGAELRVFGDANFGTGQVIVDTFSKGGNGDVVLDYEAFIEIRLPLVLLVE